MLQSAERNMDTIVTTYVVYQNLFQRFGAFLMYTHCTVLVCVPVLFRKIQEPVLHGTVCEARNAHPGKRNTASLQEHDKHGPMETAMIVRGGKAGRKM
jgi:hypothetical protein